MDGQIIRRLVSFQAFTGTSEEVLIANIARWLGINDGRIYNRVRLHVHLYVDESSYDEKFYMYHHASYMLSWRYIKFSTDQVGMTEPIDMVFPLSALYAQPPDETLEVKDATWSSGTPKTLFEIIAELMPNNTAVPYLP